MSKASAYFSVANLSGSHDIKNVKRELDSMKGVISVSVSDDRSNIAVDFDTTGLGREQIQKKLEGLGFNITGSRFENHVM